MWHMGAPTCPPPLQRCRSPCVWVQQMLAAVSWRFWTSAVITSGKESSEACTTESSRSQHRHTSQSYSFLRLVNIFPASRLTDNCPSDPFSQMDLSHPWVRGCDFIEKKSNWHSGSQEKWKRETHHFCRKHQPGHVSPPSSTAILYWKRQFPSSSSHFVPVRSNWINSMSTTFICGHVWNG